jgi:hypothetical protein
MEQLSGSTVHVTGNSRGFILLRYTVVCDF